MSANDYIIRKATPVDPDAIKVLADAHRRELGFVLRPALARSITRNKSWLPKTVLVWWVLSNTTITVTRRPHSITLP